MTTEKKKQSDINPWNNGNKKAPLWGYIEDGTLWLSKGSQLSLMKENNRKLRKPS